MRDFKAEYKKVEIPERLEMALSADLEEGFRESIMLDQHMQVRCYFARRLDLRANEVAHLLDDIDHVVRLCIAKRHDLTPEQVEFCVANYEPNVRYCIARNPLLNEEQRQRLLADEDELVVIAARKGPKEMRTRQRPGQAELIR